MRDMRYGEERSAPNAIRTRDPLLRRQVLYPLSYGGTVDVYLVCNFILFLLFLEIMTANYKYFSNYLLIMISELGGLRYGFFMSALARAMQAIKGA